MKRVIDISEDAYELLLEKGTCGKFANLGEIVANSTPLEQELTKNDLGVDCISRQALLNTTVKKNSIWNKITDSEGNNLETIISNLPSVAPQEPFMATPCISSKVCEHDRVVTLDKIRAEIETKYGRCKLTEYIVQYDGICTSANDIGDIADILQIIDKYKAESEGKE